jgi:hypothetical protein
MAIAAVSMISLAWTLPASARNRVTNGMDTASNRGTVDRVVTTCFEHPHGPRPGRDSTVTGEANRLVVGNSDLVALRRNTDAPLLAHVGAVLYTRVSRRRSSLRHPPAMVGTFPWRRQLFSSLIQGRRTY